jgi:hypothetical protein
VVAALDRQSLASRSSDRKVEPAGPRAGQGFSTIGWPRLRTLTSHVARLCQQSRDPRRLSGDSICETYSSRRSTICQRRCDWGVIVTQKVFISYASEDSDAALQIRDSIAASGFTVWLDIDGIAPGADLLEKIGNALGDVDYVVALLSRKSIFKSWVRTETRLALVHEIERGRPTVIACRLDDCEVPLELSHKRYLDFSGRVEAALDELVRALQGAPLDVAVPKQTVIAGMIRNGVAELWARLSWFPNSEWTQADAAEVVRGLRSNELEAAVAIGSRWSGQKMWEGQLVHTARRATGSGEAAARQLVKGLENAGFLREADDLDYRQQPEKAYYDTELLQILRHAARRSALFPELPAPIPERLGDLLAFGTPITIFSKGWYAIRYLRPVLADLDSYTGIVAVVVRTEPEPTTWGFRLPDDDAPLRVLRSHLLGDLPRAGDDSESAHVGFELAVFDDLGLLK